MEDPSIRIKSAFAIYDSDLSGQINREELLNVFKGIVPDFKDEHFDRIFEGTDLNHDGHIDYKEFVNFLCKDETGALVKATEYHDVDHLEYDESLNAEIKEMENEIKKSLNDVICANVGSSSITWFLGKVNLEEFGLLLRHLGFSFADAKTKFDLVCQKLGQRGGGTAHLAEFVDLLKLHKADDDELQSIAHRIAKIRCVKKFLPEPEQAKAFLDKAPRDGAIDQLVRAMHELERPAEDAWAVLNENPKGMLLSSNERRVLRKLACHPEKFLEKVKDAMKIPPLLPVSSGSLANREACQDAVKAIVKSCRAAGTKFTDPEWDITKYPDAVLYVDKTAPGYDCTVAKPAGYKRLTEIYDNPSLDIGTGEFQQGRLGTCFLLGAIGAVVAKEKDSLENLFYNYDIELGVYGIKFCLDGEMYHVIVDDWMPVDEYGRLLYARPAHGEEVWCPLLEKAYCKFNTCYEMCDGGFPSDAIFAFYGGDSGKYQLTDEYRANPSSYFKVIQDGWNDGRLLTCTFKKPEVKSTIGKCGEHVASTGLVAGHIYSIVKCVEAHGEQLICFRNPWGTGEWTGKWSDKNAQNEWTAEMAEAAGWVPENDGTFFMSISDYVANSCSVYWARTFGPAWKKTTQYGRFPAGAAKATAQWAFKSDDDSDLSFNAGDVIDVASVRGSWWRGSIDGGSVKWLPGNYVRLDERPITCFELSGVPSKTDVPMKVVVMLTQPNTLRLRRYHKKNGQNYKDTSYPQIQLIVVDPDGQAFINASSKGRSVNGELKLPSNGVWKIYAVCLEGSAPKFSLRCYSTGGRPSLMEAPSGKIDDIKQWLN